MNGIEIMWNIMGYIHAYIWLGIPLVLRGVLISLIFVILFRKKLKEHPVAFYIYPALYLLGGIFHGIARLLPNNFFEEKGLDESWVMNIGSFFDHSLGLGTAFGIGLIIIVMFIGVLPKTTFVTNLFTIRTEMSIIGASLLMGHGISQLATFIENARGWIKATAGGYAPDFFITLYYFVFSILGPIILVLLVLPWITSFRAVRKKMSSRAWKKLQTYLGVPLFIGMLMFGLVLNLADTVGLYPDYFVNIGEITVKDEPISLDLGVYLAEQLFAAKIYLALLVSYSILRIKKVRKGNRSGANLPVETPEATA
jgi:DMSO/TMAO reductase YedYZ heme-binding membrane subunit